MKICQLARFSSKTKPNAPYLIIGLGNPGKKYVDTRHNIGFEMLDVISMASGIKVTKAKFKALVGVGKMNGIDVVLAKPQTYMNLSGESVRDIAEYYKIPPEKIIIIYDDVSLDVGKIRIRPKGSAGGHNGIKNIIYHLKTDEFPRVRIGVGQPTYELVDYVLGKFSKPETSALTEIAKDMPLIIETILKSGTAAAMNRYN